MKLHVTHFASLAISLLVCSQFLASSCSASSYKDFYPDDTVESASATSHARALGTSYILEEAIQRRIDESPIPFPDILDCGPKTRFDGYHWLLLVLSLVMGPIGYYLGRRNGLRNQGEQKGNLESKEAVSAGVGKPEGNDVSTSSVKELEEVPKIVIDGREREERGETENGRQMRLALERQGDAVEAVLTVRSKLERLLETEVPRRYPATHLRSVMKRFSAKLKMAAQEEGFHITDKMFFLFQLSLVTMGVVYLLMLMHWGHGSYLSPGKVFFPSDNDVDDSMHYYSSQSYHAEDGKDGLRSSSSSPSFFSFLLPSSHSSSYLGHYLSYLFLPFGWNMLSIIPYIMAGTTILQFSSMLPCIGPILQRIAFLVLFGRFFWDFRISLTFIIILSSLISVTIGFATTRLQCHPKYFRVTCFLLAIAGGFLVALWDPQVCACRHPLEDIHQFIYHIIQ